jgi:plastocyanin
MNSGDKYQVKFTKAGTYQFHCTFHPGMEGTVTVSG